MKANVWKRIWGIQLKVKNGPLFAVSSWLLTASTTISVTRLVKLPKNAGDLGKLIVAKRFKKLPKVQ